jgi:hypothetical protein
MSSGSRMFSSAVSVGSRLNCWKMKPTRSRRSRVSALSPRPVISVPPMWTSPAVDRVQPGEAVHERGLAGAGRAHDRGELARAAASLMPPNLGMNVAVRLPSIVSRHY